MKNEPNATLADVGLYSSIDRFGDLCVHGVLDLRRSFSIDEVERAVRATVASFPILGCIYETHFYRDRWVPARSTMSKMVHVGITTDLESDTRSWTERSLDPRQVRPLRVVVLPTPNGCRLILSFSHLAMDGAGMAAVGHVLFAHLYGVRPSLPVEKRRDVARTLDGLSLRHVPMLARDLASAMLQPFRVWSAAPRERPYPKDGSTKPTSRQIVLEAATVEALKNQCGKDVRINDLFVAAIALVAAKRSHDGPVAVLYTMDLRRYSSSARLSAANVSSIVTTIVPRSATKNLPDALKTVAKITAEHRNSLAGPAFLLLPMLLTGPTPHGIVRRMVPAAHPILVELPVSRGFIFTNVGKLDQGLGPLLDDLVDLRAVGPNIKGVSAPAIIAFGLRGRIHLQLYAPPGLGEEALNELEIELREALTLPS
jgi:NRPS condensation-like uncharacterized protein